MWLVLAATALAAPLSFDDAVREALAHGADARLAVAQQDIGLGDARTVGTLLVNPSVSAERELDRTRVDGRLALPVAGQPIARARAGAALRDAAETQGDADRVRAGLAAGRAYLDAQRSQELAALAADTLQLAERTRDAALKLGSVEEVSDVDAATLQAFAAHAVQDATTAEQDALRARLALEVALGREPTGEIQADGWPELPPPDGVEPEALPDVRVAAGRAQAARSLHTLALMELVPRPVVTGGFEQDVGRTGAIVGVEVEVPLFAPGFGAAQAARGRRDLAEAQADATRRAAAADWTAALAEVERARTAYQASRIEGLRPALEAIARAWESGEYSLTEYVTRRDALVDGLVTAIDTRYRLEIAELALWDLAGQLPPEITP